MKSDIEKMRELDDIFLLYKQIFILCDENTYKHCLPKLISNHKQLSKAEIIKIDAGEKSKSFKAVEYVSKKLLQKKAEKGSLLINLGGGVITDLGGFIASIYKRGMMFINIPTSLMGMIDAAHGGKNAIDFQGQKNCIGTFNIPMKIIIDDRYLKTLNNREIFNGWVEILKHTIIFDEEQWQILKNMNPIKIKKWEPILVENFTIKQIIVKSDPKETGFRKILNFGHTVGHALEAYAWSTKETITHGEAIAAGMIAESYIAAEMNLLAEEDMVEIVSTLSCFTHKMKIPKFKKIENYIYNDKKNHEQVIRMSLPSQIGHCNYDIAVQPKLIMQALDFLKPIVSS